MTHQSKYYLNISSYLLIAVEIWNGPELGRPFSIAALIVTATSVYFLIKEQITSFLSGSTSNTGLISKHWQTITFFIFVTIIAAITIRFATII